jgi:hypothetical protein
MRSVLLSVSFKAENRIQFSARYASTCYGRGSRVLTVAIVLQLCPVDSWQRRPLSSSDPIRLCLLHFLLIRIGWNSLDMAYFAS